MSRSIIGSSVTPFRLVFLMWLVFVVQHMYGWDLRMLGVAPRNLYGMIGILTAPLIHGDIYHLISNTVPLLFLGSVLFFFYDRIGNSVFYRAYFWSNVLVWLFARSGSSGDVPIVHVGASGVVYGLAFFLIFFGIFRRDFLSLFISVIIFLTYGGIFYGVLPLNPSISWESHLAGALVGIFTAITFSVKKNVN